MSTEAGWPAGVGRLVLAEVDSTNAEAARRAPGLTQPTWILGLRQTAGRGRRGRVWVPAEGNLYATLVLRPGGTAAAAALHSFVASLALHDALAQVTGRAEPFTLKWPNDVLLNGGKLSGILLESTGAGQGVSALAVGIGVNLAWAPPSETVEPGAVRPVSLLGETGLRIAPEEFLTPLAAAYARRAADFAAGGFAAIRAPWLSRAARIGEKITARTGATSREGIFETVDETGALVLLTPAGRVAVPAADVYF